ncbi:MAG TPA: phosphate--AMP phosphotransferase [Polyangia bacterium]|jgi:polyphosphate kinase 2 (PPK2 family)
MLDQVNLGLTLDRDAYRARLEPLLQRLFDLQQQARELKVPIIVVVEGWDESGKGRAIQLMTGRLDARGYRVYAIGAPTEDEAAHPFLWRFWQKLPPRGRMAIFDRGWYGRVLVERVDKLVSKKEWRGAYAAINDFERTLTDDGYVLVKLWLHISEREQGRRIRKCLKDETLRWKISPADRRQHRRYDKWQRAVEDLLSETGSTWAPWSIIEAEDLRFGEVKAVETVVAAIEDGLRRHPAVVAAGAAADPERAAPPAPAAPAPAPATILATVDLSRALTREEYQQEAPRLQVRLNELQRAARERRVPVVIGYEGWDAAGKGGNIRRLIEKLDPRGYDVIPIAAPSAEEKARHYLWRFWRALPEASRLTIFDRTWYGRVLVERVEGLCTPAEWQRAYREINEFEQQLTDFGAVLVKFWLHISQDEQLRRFKEREEIAYKRWKITEEDWRNRDRWSQYEPAVAEMLERTSTRHAPWTIIEGNCKLWARVKTLRTVCEAIAARL